VTRSDDRGDHPLGLVPHQIRGFLANFENITVTGKSYSCCSACSDKVTSAYKEQGWNFVRKALNERGYVEELSGLKEVRGPHSVMPKSHFLWFPNIWLSGPRESRGSIGRRRVGRGLR
jgi:hypothetical protein